MTQFLVAAVIWAAGYITGNLAGRKDELDNVAAMIEKSKRGA